MMEITEEQIMHGWDEKNTDSPRVSVECIAYNQETYIEKALDSFLMQRTNFPFEIVVHDDASTDETAEIIKKYEKAFPHIIKPIYEIENQYSKHDNSIERVMNACVRGIYIALCEADDFWCDENKLQKQYDFMETHKECILCCHNSVIHHINESAVDGLFNKWKEVHKLSDADIFFGWKVHTSSYFFRKDLSRLSQKFVAIFGDYVLLTLACSVGEVVALPDVMSVYNANISTGATARYYGHDSETRIRTIKMRKDYLRKYNKFTNEQFREIVNLRIAELELQCSNSKEELLNAAMVLRKSRQYRKIIKEYKLTARIKTWIKIYGSILGDIWYQFMLKRINAN